MPAGRRPSSSILRATLAIPRATLALATTAYMLVACGETITQIGTDDVVGLLLSADSAQVGVGRTLQLRAYPLDATGALLVGQAVSWQSTAPALATVDDEGLVTGVSAGTASIIAQLGGHADTTFLTVEIPATLVLSADSVGFDVVAGGADPAPDSIDITNSGVLPLVGLAVDSIVYGPGASGWLTTQLDSPLAPATLELAASATGLTTSGVYAAVVWLSAPDTNGSPASVLVTLRIGAGNAASMTLDGGDAQTRTVGAAVTTAPSVLVEDTFGNPVVAATVDFAVTGGGGSLTGASPVTNAAGIARVGSWTLGTVAGPNQLTATLGVLSPVVFTATGSPAAATQIVVTAGNDQSAVAGNAVAVPPAVTVTDDFGNGVESLGVTFTVTAGGGGVAGGSQTTNGVGLATVGSWTLGAVAGANSLRATSPGVPDTAFITATGLTGQADSIYLVAGNAQSDTVGATLPVAYSVRVVDSNGNGVSGIPVSWSVTGGGGSIGSSSTDATGFATAIRVLGTAPGTHTANAAVGGLAGSPVQFTATASVGSPDEIRITAGNTQSATVNTAVSTDPQVVVEDKFNNPIQGHSVTFAVTGGGGAVAPTTAITTLANGTATVTSWTLGTAAGTNNNTLRATAGGGAITGNPRTFTASATAGAPTSIAISAGNNQTAITGSPVATDPTVVVRDQYNNPVPNITVNFTTSGGSVGSPSPATGATGQAATTWAVNVAGGAMQSNGTFPNTLTATVNGTAISTSFTGSAIYSYADDVNGMFATSCSGCHAGLTGSSNLTFDGNPAQDYAELLTEYTSFPFCDSTLTSYRRVRTGGGDTAHAFSILRIFMEGIGSDAVGACGPHGTKVSAANLAILRAWIRNGAPNN